MATPQYEVESEVDFSRSRTQVWLLRVPAVVQREWAKAQAGAVLGELVLPAVGEGRLTSAATGNTSTVTLERPDTSEEPCLLQVVSERVTDGGHFALEGRVEVQAEVTQSLDGTVVAAMLEEAKNATASTLHSDRKMIMLDVRDPSTRRRPELPPPTAKRARPASDRRDRMEKDALVSALFEVFSAPNATTTTTATAPPTLPRPPQQQYRSLRELQEATNQPIAWLREVLAGIADQVKSGPNRSMFTLKPQFQLVVAKPQDEADEEGDEDE